MRNRRIGINIRVSEQEKRRIFSKAKKCKLSVSEYLRQLANGHCPQELPHDSMYDLCWQIELLIDEFGRQKDEKFKSYLTNMLNDLRAVCYPKGGGDFGSDQDLAGS